MFQHGSWLKQNQNQVLCNVKRVFLHSQQKLMKMKWPRFESFYFESVCSSDDRDRRFFFEKKRNFGKREREEFDLVKILRKIGLTESVIDLKSASLRPVVVVFRRLHHPPISATNFKLPCLSLKPRWWWWPNKKQHRNHRKQKTQKRHFDNVSKNWKIESERWYIL